MVKHGCEKKRDGKGQLGEEMLGKGRDEKRNAENRRDEKRNAEQRQRNEEKSIARNSKGAATLSMALTSEGMDALGGTLNRR